MRNFTICSGFPFVLLRVHSFLFTILCSGIVWTGEVRQADMLVSEFSGSQRGECYVIRAL